MDNERYQTAILNRGLRIFFSEFVRVTLSRPSQAVFFLKVVWRQIQAAKRRKSNEKKGFHIPPIAIFSITNRCNLRCKGCYAQALREASPDELSARRIREIIVEAEGLGVSFFVIAGGEPLLRPEIMDITRDVPRSLFLVVTNGLLLDVPLIRRLQEQRNTVPALSLEGTPVETDGRRGAGVHARLSEKMRELRKVGVFFSLSITLTRSNFDVVTNRTFLQDAVEAGCRFFLFLEYTPIKEDTEDWVLTADQRQAMKDLLVLFRRQYKAVFIGVPWDEEESGGCLASGRGFVHINAAGDLEPCPFAPFSDVNLKETDLAEALQSNFLKRLRDNHDRFAEVSGGCALWKNREWVGSVLERKLLDRNILQDPDLNVEVLMDKIKTIALVAHDNRKPDLGEWVEFNYWTLVRHKLVCTGTTGRLVEEIISRKFERDHIKKEVFEITKLKSGPLGGDQQLGGMIAEGRIDFVIFFWDPMEPHPHDVDVKALLRIAVVYNIPIACNRSTADFMISSPIMNEAYNPVVKDYTEHVQRRV